MKKKDKRYVILSQQGSGASLLRALLNSHSQIFFATELFLTRIDKDTAFCKKGVSVSEFLDRFYCREMEKDAKRKVVGFDLKYNQMNSDLLGYLKDKGLPQLLLQRLISSF